MAGPLTYRAVADTARARAVAGTGSPFTIEVRFLGGLTEGQRQAFRVAADRWSRIIVGDLPDATVGGETVDDVRIDARGVAIDGPAGVLGRAGPTQLRPASAGASAYLPVTGTMEFDSADLAEMESGGTLDDVITHEMGHVLGFGTLWARKGLLAGAGTNDPTYGGAGGVAEYAALRGRPDGAGVPVEDSGGQGTRDSHWREAVFGAELMTGYVEQAANPLSRLTAAAMADLGYQVDLDAAEPYTLPSPSAVRRRGHKRHARPRGTDPTVLS
ncbi:MAG TPA: leishmanolysin-related zinc metalloendopeptidase [Pseudonocardia sp.]|jgi:hypothetical protein